MNPVAIVVVVIAAFVMSSAYYMITGRVRAEILGTDPQARPEPWKPPVELVRSGVLAVVLAVFVDQQDIHSWTGGLVLGLLCWLAFPAVLLSGSVMWDGARTRLAVIHGGDWLIKILMMTIVLSVWR